MRGAGPGSFGSGGKTDYADTDRSHVGWWRREVGKFGGMGT